MRPLCPQWLAPTHRRFYRPGLTGQCIQNYLRWRRSIVLATTTTGFAVGSGKRDWAPDSCHRQPLVEVATAIFALQQRIFRAQDVEDPVGQLLSLIHISEPTRLGMISYAVFC